MDILKQAIVTYNIQKLHMGYNLLSTLPAGIYFLQLSDERQRVVRKFVKE